MRKDLTLFIIITSLLLITGCKPDTLKFSELSSQVTITTTDISAVTQTTASGGVQVATDFSGDIQRKGICWATTRDPTTSNNSASGGSGSGFTVVNLSGLAPGTTYYVRAYAVTAQETIYGSLKSFLTAPYQVSTITTTSVTSVTQTGALSGGGITTAGGGTVTARGICWSTVSNPVLSNSHTADGSGTGSFTSTLSGLTPGTTYYVRAYATNQAGTAYGNQISFVTSPYTLATITTPSISNVTQTGANSSSTITAVGGGNVSMHGICWNTTGSPTISNTHTSDGSGIGTYSSGLGSLSPGTTYYVRAYATNEAGTAYSSQVSFTTTPVQLATVTIPSISSISKISAISTASVTADGGGSITTRGACWSSSTSAPTITNSNSSSSGSGLGSFNLSLTGLITGTTYYVRTYATNAAGTSYSSVISFRTL